MERHRELALRMAEAFESPLKAFIFQRGLDGVSLVLKVIREAGLQEILDVRLVERERGIYVVLVNDRGCRAFCAYDYCREADEECVRMCVERCRRERVELVARKLREYGGLRREAGES